MSDDFDPDENENDSEGISDLRKKFKAQNKELAELRAFREQASREKRQASVADILKAKGAPAAAAKFYTEEDTSEDAVGKWLEANADVFPVNASTEQAAPATAQVPDENALAAQRVMQQSFGQSPTGASTELRDPIERRRALETLPIEELVKQGLMPDPKAFTR